MHDVNYFPILRAKSGEISAVGHLSPLTRSRMRPIFDFPVYQDNEKRTLPEYLAETIRDIRTAWGTERPLLFDFSRYAPNIDIGDGRHPVEFIFNYARQSRMKAIPVSGPQSIRGPELNYLEAVRRIATHDQLGVAIRIPFEDLLLPASLGHVIEATLELFDLTADGCDLILDADALERHARMDDPLSELRQIVRSAIRMTSKYRFRTVVFCASSIPEKVGPQYNAEPYRTSRVEFAVWKELLSDSTLPLVLFGDYGIIPPFQTDTNKPVQPPSRIRLSTNAEHVLYRAPRDEHQRLCKEVIETPTAHAQAPSWGMNATRACGRGYGGVGIPCTWIARDTNAHIETTVAEITRQLSSSKRSAEFAFSDVEVAPWLQTVFDVT
jgi:hypothetical protein